MIKPFLTTALSLALLCSVGCSHESAASDSRLTSVDETNDLIVVVSPYLSDRSGALEQVFDWFIPRPGLHLAFVDGLEATQIADAQVPRVENFSKATVLEKLRKPLTGLKHWTEDSPPSAFEENGGMLAIPLILSRLEQSGSRPKYLFIMGSPVLRFPGDSSLDFKSPRLRYPSVGHFSCVSSPFSCVGRETSLSGVTVVMAFPKEDTSAWPATYEEKLQEFYSQLIARRGGTLAAFTPDIGMALRALTQPQAATRVLPAVALNEASAEPKMIDATARPVVKDDQPKATNVVVIVQTNPAPVVVFRTTVVTNVVTHTIITNLPPQPAPQPIRVAAGNPNQVTISVHYWSTSAVCDLRVTPYGGADEIAFDNAQSPLGRYVASVDLRTGEQTKTVTLPAGLEPGKASVALNYASGSGTLSGTVRWETESGISEMPFLFSAQKGGGQQRQGHRRLSSSQWIVVDLFALTSAKKSAQNASSAQRPEHQGLWSSSGQASQR